MASSSATTVAAYLASLPADRRKAVCTVRATVKKAMPRGYKESIALGMIVWAVPLSVLPDTYNGHPLWYAALAAQKNYCALYLMGVYGSPTLLAELKAGYREAGIRLDMGKSCVRFRSLDGVALDVVSRVVSRVPMDEYVRMYHKSRRK